MVGEFKQVSLPMILGAHTDSDEPFSLECNYGSGHCGFPGIHGLEVADEEEYKMGTDVPYGRRHIVSHAA